MIIGEVFSRLWNLELAFFPFTSLSFQWFRVSSFLVLGTDGFLLVLRYLKPVKYQDLIRTRVEPLLLSHLSAAFPALILPFFFIPSLPPFPQPFISNTLHFSVSSGHFPVSFSDSHPEQSICLSRTSTSRDSFPHLLFLPL